MRRSAGFASLPLFLMLAACAASSGSDLDGAAGASSGGTPGATGGSGGTSSGGSGPAAGGGATTGGSASGGTATGGTATGGSAAGGASPFVPTECVGDVVYEPTGTPPALTPGQWHRITPPGICEGAHFGCMDMHVHPCNTAVLYLTTDMEGMWRSADAGATWTHIGNVGQDFWCDAPQLDSPGVMQINPADPQQMYYIGGVRGCTAGFWVSSDGGDTWTQPAGFAEKADNSADGWSNDLYDVKADPADFDHVLVTFHAPWNWSNPAGVLESTDGGTSWSRVMPEPTWGTGHSIYFLNDSSTWLIGTQGDGYWRTTNSGDSWTQVSDRDMQHGGTDAYYSKTGVLYVGALGNILRSTDNGVTFTMVGPNTGNGYYDIVGDGERMYAQLANTGSHGGAPEPYVTSPEDDGTTWTPHNSQTFTDGPYRMDFDPVNRIVYSANWNAGVWSLKVE